MYGHLTEFRIMTVCFSTLHCGKVEIHCAALDELLIKSNEMVNASHIKPIHQKRTPQFTVDQRLHCSGNNDAELAIGRALDIIKEFNVRYAGDVSLLISAHLCWYNLQFGADYLI